MILFVLGSLLCLVRPAFQEGEGYAGSVQSSKAARCYRAVPLDAQPHGDWSLHGFVRDRTLDGELYRAAIPVLTEVDVPMLREVRRLGREVMEAWFVERHHPLRRSLAGLSFVRNGVPLEDGFYWVWHYVFGVANRELAGAGLLIDPYGAGSRFRGFLPVVWLSSVTKE